MNKFDILLTCMLFSMAFMGCIYLAGEVDKLKARLAELEKLVLNPQENK